MGNSNSTTHACGCSKERKARHCGACGEYSSDKVACQICGTKICVKCKHIGNG